eukprot:c3486_g1_i2.p1 GENE.c3486_g1_i2~~c3486_g1_i2.p1  ORF type:complete len:524 (+),score=125.84 c3486_g1_i2:102-1574(+)
MVVTATGRVARSFAASAAAASGETQDVVIVGGGPGGYVAAIKAGQLGMKVTCVESRGTLGGTCLNVGCIPSKALLNATHLYHMSHGYFKQLGMTGGENVKMDIGLMQAGKKDSVVKLTSGIEMLFKKNKVNYAKGFGRLTSPTQVTVDLAAGGKQVINTKAIVIATGSEPIALPFMPFDEKKVVSSTGALALESVPKRMAVIGGGVIGLELGSVWARLGAEVSVIEFNPAIGAGMDGEIVKAFERELKKQGLIFKTSTKVTGGSAAGAGVSLNLESTKTGAKETAAFDVVLVSIGRRAYTDRLGAKELGVAMNERGVISIKPNFQTNIPSIYAIGDVAPGPMLAHKAEEEGIAVIEHLHGGDFHMSYDAIPSVIYTSPEVAWVGKTEEQLVKEGVAFKKGVFPFAANSRAKTNMSTAGMVKVLARKDDDRLLGVHIMNDQAGELISEMGLALTFGASAEDVARTCHAHPTLAEAVKEAAMAAHDNKPIHF